MFQFLFSPFLPSRPTMTVDRRETAERLCDSDPGWCQYWHDYAKDELKQRQDQLIRIYKTARQDDGTFDFSEVEDLKDCHSRVEYLDELHRLERDVDYWYHEWTREASHLRKRQRFLAATGF